MLDDRHHAGDELLDLGPGQGRHAQDVSAVAVPPTNHNTHEPTNHNTHEPERTT